MAGRGENLGTAYVSIAIDTAGIDAGLRAAQGAFEQTRRGIGQSLQDVGNTISGIGGNLTALTAPMAAFGVLGVRTASQYEDALKQIEVRAGATADEIAEIDAVARRLGRDTAFGPAQVAEGMLELMAAGNSAADAVGLIDTVLAGASASGQSMAFVGNQLTNVLNSFGLGVEDADEVMQHLIASTGTSSNRLEDVTAAFANVGPMARAMGLDVEETAAIMGIFANAGIEGASAGTSLRAMLVNMTADTDSTKSAWQRLGTSMFDAEGNMRDMTEVIRDINAGMETMTDEQRARTMQDLAGTYGRMGLEALLAANGTEEMVLQMRRQAAIADIAAARMDTFSGAVTFLKGSFELLMIDAMQPLMDNVLRPMVMQISDVVNAISGWVQANPELAGTIIKVLAVITALGPILLIVGKAIVAFGGLIAGVGAAFGLLLSPIGLIIAAVVALAAAFHTNFLGIRDFLEPILYEVARLLSVAASAARQLAVIFMLWLSNAAVWLQQKLEEVRVAAGQLAVIVLPVLARAAEWLREKFEAVRIAAQQLAVIITAVLATAANWLRTQLENVITAVQQLAVIMGVVLPIAISWVQDRMDELRVTIANLGKTLIEAVTAVREFVRANGEVLVAMALIIGAILAVQAVATALIAVKAALAAAFTGVSAAGGVLGGVLGFLFSPVVLLTAALAALLYAIQELYPGGIAGVLRDAATAAQQLGFIFMFVLATAADWVRTKIEEFVNTVTGIRDAIAGALGWLHNTFAGVFGAMRDVVQGVIDAVNSIVGAVRDAQAAIDGIGGTIAAGGAAITEITTGGHSIGDIFSAVGRAISDEVAGRDSGGPGRAGMPYLIGRGAQPELFVPSTNGQFIPNIDQMLSGDTYNLSVSVPLDALRSIPDAQRNGQEFGETILRVLRERGAR